MTRQEVDNIKWKKGWHWSYANCYEQHYIAEDVSCELYKVARTMKHRDGSSGACHVSYELDGKIVKKEELYKELEKY